MSANAATTPTPSTRRELTGWLLTVARPVLGPLAASTIFRIIGHLTNVALLVSAVSAVTALLGSAPRSMAAQLWILVGLALLKALCAYLEQYTGHLVAFKALARLRSYFYDRLEPQAPAAVQGRESGDLMARATKDIDRIETFFAHTIAPAIAAVVVPVTVTVWMALAVDPLSALIAFIGWFVVGAVVPLLGGKSTARGASKLRYERGALAHHVTDSIQGTEEVLTFGITRRRLDQMRGYELQIGKHLVGHANWTGLRRGLNACLQMLTPALVLIAGAGRVGNEITVTDLVVAVVATMATMPSVLAVEEFVAALDDALAAARAVADVTEAESIVSEPTRPASAPSSPAGVELTNVAFTYPGPTGGGDGGERPSSSPVLNGVNLSVDPGEVVAIVGVSGSGKSTIGAMIARFWDPQAGTVRIGGVGVRELSEAGLRSAVTLVPQRPFLFSGTVRENLLMAAPDADDDELIRACSSVALDLSSAALPDGLDTAIGELGGGVSGGQRQRIALARALLRGAPVLVLDEVTSDLDPATEAEVAASLRALAPERTLIFIAHRPATAVMADRVFVVDGGKIVESGAPADLAELGGPFAELMARAG
ncbi:MAG: amino acid ABC transporter ATP-binding/permease protein [Ancrocorticia sp.]|uniref:amino acid ABC transporter ATP-binding/permease protein n=1 Tax=Ancrocorticia sp. TaxID=2593684 RepID=UPI003F925011